jgi:hypothetical protein
MTPAEQQQILRLKKEVTPMERVEAESGLTAWENAIQRADKSLSKKQSKLTKESTSKSLHSLPSVSKSKNIPPVRGSGSAADQTKMKVDKAGHKPNQSSLDDEDVANNIRLSGVCSRLPIFSKTNIVCGI